MTKVKFCWECGRRLWGGGKFFKRLMINGNLRILHKSCADIHYPGIPEWKPFESETVKNPPTTE